MTDDIFDDNTTRSPKSKVRARCPACNTWVSLRDTAEVWDPVTCPECDASLEITELRPPTLDYASDASPEDWDEADWEEDWNDSRGGKKGKRH